MFVNRGLSAKLGARAQQLRSAGRRKRRPQVSLLVWEQWLEVVQGAPAWELHFGHGHTEDGRNPAPPEKA